VRERQDAGEEPLSKRFDDAQRGLDFVAADADLAAHHGVHVAGLSNIVFVDNAHLVSEQVALLEDPARHVPLVWRQAIGEVEAERLLDVATRPAQILERDVCRLLGAHLAAESVERRDDVLECIADKMVGQFLLDRFGEPCPLTTRNAVEVVSEVGGSLVTIPQGRKLPTGV
jgi:hypothetical protein